MMYSGSGTTYNQRGSQINSPAGVSDEAHQRVKEKAEAKRERDISLLSNPKGEKKGKYKKRKGK